MVNIIESFKMSVNAGNVFDGLFSVANWAAAGLLQSLFDTVFAESMTTVFQ